MQAGMQASLRSLRLRESDRAPANAGARLRLRAEVRRSRVAQAGLVVSVGIGTTRLRRPQSVTPPRDGLRPRSGTVPPATAYRPRPGAAPLRRRPDLALELCLRDGVSASVWCRVPRDSVSTPLWGPRPLPWRRAPALCPRSRGARCEKPSVLVAGGQNRRFFAVSEVGNGRFCRLFAYGLSGSANNRAFWS